MIHQHSQLKIRKTVGENRQSIGVFRGRRKGMTLIEVVISLALFSMLSIPVAMFVNTSVSMNKKSELKQQASLVGQSVLEELGLISQLNVGENDDLFGSTRVVLKIERECESALYCINDLNIDDFKVNLNFNPLNESSSSLYEVEVIVKLDQTQIFDGIRVVSLKILED